MTIQKKKKLAFLLTAGGLIATTLVTIPTILTSCSSQANPYFPSTSIKVIINGTPMDFYFVNNTSGNGGIYLGTSTDGQDIYDLRKSFDDAQKAIDDAGGENKADPSLITKRDAALSKLNAMNIVSIIIGMQNTLFANLFSLLMKQDSTQQSPSWWSTFVGNDTVLKEYTIASMMNAGESKPTFALGPKHIELSINYNDKKEIIGSDYVESNMQNYNQDVTIDNYTVTYAWYKNHYNGGAWLETNDKSTVPEYKYLSLAQKDELKKIGSGYDKGYITPEYKFNLKGFIYNLYPMTKSIPKDGSNKEKKQIFTGEYKINTYVWNKPKDGEKTKDTSPVKWITANDSNNPGLGYEKCTKLQKMNANQIIHDSIQNNHNNLNKEIAKILEFFNKDNALTNNVTFIKG